MNEDSNIQDHVSAAAWWDRETEKRLAVSGKRAVKKKLL